MALIKQMSDDAQGILRVVDVNGVVLFDRVNGISLPGWSARLATNSHYKTCDETTGKITSKHS